MSDRAPDMNLLEIARDKGMITDADLQAVREEHFREIQQGRNKTPTRIAIERGILSDEDSHDLETEAWIRTLPKELGNYRLTRLLGRGGMAVVFEAQDTSLGKVVAIKLLLREFSTSDAYLARFHREARIAAKLTHPNAVQVVQAGEQNGMQYLVMEYVEGETVASVIKGRGRIPEDVAVDMVLQVSGALEEAASLGIIHRDIKPGNILVSKWRVPKLADFGIAKEFTDIRDARIQQSLTMGVVGTPTYMSPEQARGARDLDFRSDIYSLGATLYHMLTGEMPFYSPAPQETMVRVVSEAPRPPKEALPELSDSTAAVLCKMMAKKPEDRYDSFAALQADLLAARDGEPASVTYEEALELTGPQKEEAAAQGDSLFRVLGVAFAVVIIGVILLCALRGCG